MSTSHTYSRYICISTNQSCNLNCIYCYEKNKTNIVFNEFDAIQKLQNILRFKTRYGTRIKIHGGEPFFVFKKIRTLCETIWQLDLEEDYLFLITTNGTLIHGEIANWLSKNKERVRIKLSLDGDKTSQDMNRSNSFDLIDIPFFVHTWPDMQINMTVSPKTLPYLAHNVKYLHSVGFKHIISHLAIMTDWSNRNDLMCFYKQLIELVEFYLQNTNIEPCSFLNHKIEDMLKDKTGTICGLGNNKKAYDFETGCYYPCHLFFPSVCNKNINNLLKRVDFSKIINQESPICQTCPLFNICHTCYAENYSLRNSLTSRDMIMCQYQKIMSIMTFRYEYARILQTKEPTRNDILKMQTISKYSKYIQSIEKELIHVSK